MQIDREEKNGVLMLRIRDDLTVDTDVSPILSAVSKEAAQGRRHIVLAFSRKTPRHWPPKIRQQRT